MKRPSLKTLIFWGLAIAATIALFPIPVRRVYALVDGTDDTAPPTESVTLQWLSSDN